MRVGHCHTAILCVLRGAGTDLGKAESHRVGEVILGNENACHKTVELVSQAIDEQQRGPEDGHRGGLP